MVISHDCYFHMRKGTLCFIRRNLSRHLRKKIKNHTLQINNCKYKKEEEALFLPTVLTELFRVTILVI